MNRLGVCGGTFDPIHMGHLFIAEEAGSRLELDRVLFVPAREPPHRQEAPEASAAHRLAMVRLGVAGNPRFEVSLLEVERQGPSYTVDTLKVLRKAEPGSELFFIVGMDSLADLAKWHDPAGILGLARLVAVARGGHEEWDRRDLEAAVPEARGRVIVLPSPQLEISATDLRRRIADGRSCRYLAPDAVLAYIEQHGLYRRSDPEPEVISRGPDPDLWTMGPE